MAPRNGINKIDFRNIVCRKMGTSWCIAKTPIISKKDSQWIMFNIVCDLTNSTPLKFCVSPFGMFSMLKNGTRYVSEAQGHRKYR